MTALDLWLITLTCWGWSYVADHILFTSRARVRQRRGGYTWPNAHWRGHQ